MVHFSEAIFHNMFQLLKSRLSNCKMFSVREKFVSVVTFEIVSVLSQNKRM